MNEIKKALLADPRHLSPEMEAQVAANAELSALRQQLLAQDEGLREAFAEVKSPAGLADRIILRARYPQRSRWYMAAAAGVAGLATLLMLQFKPAAPMALAMTEHVAESAEEWGIDRQIAISEATASLGQLGVAYRDAGYRVRSLNLCVVAGRVGRHLVLDTPHGRIALMVVPHMGQEIRRRESLTHDGLRAVVMPGGPVAIGAFAQKQMDVAQLEAVLRQVFPLLERTV